MDKANPNESPEGMQDQIPDSQPVDDELNMDLLKDQGDDIDPDAILEEKDEEEKDGDGEENEQAQI